MNGRLEKEIQFYNKLEAKLKTLPPVLNEYYISLRANRKSYMSIGVYINNVLHFIKTIYTDKIPDNFYQSIQVFDVEKYFISLETRDTVDGEKRIGDDILQQRWGALRNFFDFLIKRGYLNNNPILDVDRPKNQTEHTVTYLTKVEINKLFKAIERNPSQIKSCRDKTIISLGLATGMRASAIVNINISDIDFDNSIINVIEKRKKVREIAIGENIKKQLQQWIQIRNEFFGVLDTDALFVSQRKCRITGKAVNDVLKKYCDVAGITKNITMHKLRSSAACLLARNQIPVKAIAKQLGHNQISTTMRYLDVFNEDMEKSKNILDNIL